MRRGGQMMMFRARWRLRVALPLGGHTYMTSALRGREGGCPKRDNSTDRLREWDSDKGGGKGAKNPKILRTSFKYRPLVVAGATSAAMIKEGITKSAPIFAPIELHLTPLNHTFNYRRAPKVLLMIILNLSTYAQASDRLHIRPSFL